MEGLAEVQMALFACRHRVARHVPQSCARVVFVVPRDVMQLMAYVVLHTCFAKQWEL